ncbi:MAG: deaminase [Chloroflexi bacterium]|nr:deaminase [Chloroflexota bacterium]
MAVTDARAYTVILISTSVDARVSLGPGRIWTDDLTDPRNAREGDTTYGADAWREASEYIERKLHPRGEMQGMGSFVREGEELAALPPFPGDASLLYEDYMPEELQPQARSLRWLLVTDGRGRLRGGYTGAERPDCHILHLTSRAAPPEYLAFLHDCRIPYLVLGQERVDLPLAMRRLRTDLGIECVLSEAGGRLNGALLRAGLVDELHLILRPELIGGSRTPALFDGPDLTPDQWPDPLRLDAATVRAGGYLWLRYSVAAKHGTAHG